MAASQTNPEKNSELKPPPGLKSLIDHLITVYPDQPNPLQVTTLLKYWLGGSDPLDYISMYSNNGQGAGDEERILPHWHYVSFGLSDLHGDQRVHLKEEHTTRSGMGFELTFRLAKTEAELRQQRECPDKSIRPPTWPANLLQSIARYCFQTGNGLCFGDNIPWRKCLDGGTNSRMQSLLVAQDPQLASIDTPFGTVDFCQIVGVTEEELEQASRWNGRGVLNFLAKDVQTGGDWLVTNLQRTMSVFELFPETLLNLQDDLEKQGSDLAGVNAEFTFREQKPTQMIKQEIDFQSLNERCASDENNRPLTDSQVKREEPSFPQSMSMSSSSLHKSCPLDYQPQAPDCISLDGIEITLAPYAAKYLLLAIKDRIRHGRHFTFKAQHLALTLVAETVTGAAVSVSEPFGVLGYWIQVLIPNDLVPRMMEAFCNAQLNGKTEPTKRLEFDWPDKNFKLIVDQPICAAPLPAAMSIEAPIN
ncbi:suppressor of fused homolog [Drosophila grimshawi]|uniref:Suppressor of fused homolog n=1 Tax=Drosophila grimshawi TaxID=7222 RepID=B4JRS9_DROGR|nr:suppressor of fused homolog [Drosophila grimshawi]EDV94469.1 GH19571 [Drosophila grimshawi]